MNSSLQAAVDFIASQAALDQNDAATLINLLKEADKALTICEFKLHRVEKEKKAVSVLLEETIDELQKKSLVVESANKALTQTLENLKEAQDQLVMQEKMASLGQLTAGVAHEINNPINFVSANVKPLKDDLGDILDYVNRLESAINEQNLHEPFAEVLKHREHVDITMLMTEVQDLLKGIEEGASRTSEIVKGLRNFSRVDQNAIKKANLNEGLDSTLTLLHSTYKDKVEIVKRYGDIPEIDCFPGQINQVFMNILSNAVQAIEGSGQIIITTNADQKNVHISIRDNGSGMTEETRKKIFDPFFTTKEVGKGTGLGLSISYGIVKKHEGRIEVHSSAGEGSEFIITLPIHQKKEFQHATPGLPRL